MTTSLFKRLVLPGLAAACAVGALVSPQIAGAANGSPVPDADVASIAKRYGVSESQVRDRQAALGPIISQLAPRGSQPTVKPKLKVTKVAKAPVDECFIAIGQDGPTPNADGTCASGQPKRNQTYVFGATRADDYMYYGTTGNALCLAGAAYGFRPAPYVDQSVVCEADKGWAARHLGWKVFGDVHRPSIYRINADTNKLEDLTPTDEQAPALKYSAGIRGAGAHDGVVLMGGVSMNETGTSYAGVELIAYDAKSGELLGETLLPQYANIRRGEVIDGELYFGVRLAGTGSGSGGAVVKWTGSKADPFQFEVVAQGLPAEPAYLTGYNGHIITSGWTAISSGKAVGAMPEMYMSPKIPTGGLTNATADAGYWKGIFKTSDYDPDPVIARATQFGDLTEYNGKLVFSTYVYNGFGTLNAFNAYGRPEDEVGRLNTYVNAERALAVFEMENVGQPDQKVRLLYGATALPTYDTEAKAWTPEPNMLNQTAKFGDAGFGNRFNTYSWMWQKYKGSLYMGTLDGTSVFPAAKLLAGTILGLSDMTVDLLKPVFDLNYQLLGGADVWRFDNSSQPAVPETLDGFGNKKDHGVRAWAAFPEKDKLFAGMATWATLDMSPKTGGGWEVNQLAG